MLVLIDIVFIVTLVAFYHLRKIIKTSKKMPEGAFEAPEGVITRENKDPLSQAMWACLDSGQVATYEKGDDYISLRDADGKVTRKQLEESGKNED